MSKSQRTAVYDHVKVLSSMIVMYNRNMMVNVVRIDATPRMASNAMANRDGIRGRAIFQACCDDPSPEKKKSIALFPLCPRLPVPQSTPSNLVSPDCPPIRSSLRPWARHALPSLLLAPIERPGRRS